MNKKALILDLDGTLYFQLGVQGIMGCRMLLYYFVHFWKWKELLAILYYRKIREMNTKEIVSNQYMLVGKKYDMKPEHVERIVQIWLFQKPLAILKIMKDRELSKMIQKCKEKGLAIFIYSDYPTEEKLNVLKIPLDKAYDSTCPEIHTLKPDTKGLAFILKSNHLNREDVLYIGDRDSKDGECARGCKVEYVILPKFFRRKKYKEILQKVGL